MRTLLDRFLKTTTSGGIWVASLSLAIVAVTSWATWNWWSYLSLNDSPTNVLRNVALIAGVFIAWIFAYWRSSIAKQQADIAKQEHYHARFQTASELLAKQGIDNSHARISGLHAFRYLIHDAPDLSPAAIEVVTSFMIQTPIDQHHDISEFTLVRMTADFFCDTIDSTRSFDTASRLKMREDVHRAVSKVITKFQDAGVDPYQPVE